MAAAAEPTPPAEEPVVRDVDLYTLGAGESAALEFVTAPVSTPSSLGAGLVTADVPASRDTLRVSVSVAHFAGSITCLRSSWS